MSKKKVIIIAEAGVNHNGDVKTAKELIKVASRSGADIVKFQHFKTQELVTPSASIANYQKKINTEEQTQSDLLKSLELSDDDFKELLDYSNDQNIEFLATGFNLESLDFLVKLGIKRIKIPSGEINNLPYLRKVSEYNLPVILSTGMSDMQEVTRASEILIESGLDKEKLTLLHCTTAYPASFKSINLLAMQTMKEQLNVSIGYSDHTQGIEVALSAVALGATVIEKHFTLSKKSPGPDHLASIEPEELTKMVTSIRNVEESLGSSKKIPSEEELENLKVSRKSIVARVNIKKGERFSEENLTLKRPADGISPMYWDDVLGKRAKQDYKKDDFIFI